MDLPPPTTFSLPAKFNRWRPNQAEATESQTEVKPRFLLQVCPTGFGKSIVYLTASQLIPGRTVILTSTKGLQSQLISDFGSVDGVVDIRGRQNYPCRLNTKLNCDFGLCVFGMKCSFKEEGGCFYFDQLNRAKHAKVVITNYAYWMSQNEYSDGLGKFNLLVLDEAHSSPDHVIDHISVYFGKKEVINKMLGLNDSLPNDYNTWHHWASNMLIEAKAAAESAKLGRKEKLYSKLKRLVNKLDRLTSIDQSWVWEDNPYSVTLSPTWPAPFVETILFLGIPKVVLTSATVVPKTASLLGISPNEIKMEEYPHSFPLKNRPLTHLPTVRMNYRNGELEHKLWTNKVDQIIRDRIGTKGIIHTVSYARRNMVLERSRYSEHMLTHERRNTESVVRTFKQSDAPCILVSPSMATGWDFPDMECRWQIIVKLPYPDLRGAIMKARSRKDKEYVNYLVTQQLVQTTGRGTRNVNDWCETFIIDNCITYFIKQNEHLMVDWFKGSYRQKITIPLPLKEETIKGELLCQNK